MAANLAPDDIKLLPPEGVYASVVQIEGMEGKYYALTNIGRNPTVGDHNELRIETHVVEFSGDLYDRMITVRIYQRTDTWRARDCGMNTNLPVWKK